MVSAGEDKQRATTGRDRAGDEKRPAGKPRQFDGDAAPRQPLSLDWRDRRRREPRLLPMYAVRGPGHLSISPSICYLQAPNAALWAAGNRKPLQTGPGHCFRRLFPHDRTHVVSIKVL